MKTEKACSTEHLQYLRRIRRSAVTVTSLRIGILLLMFVLWEVAATTGIIDPFIMSSPFRIVQSIGNLARERVLLLHIGITMYETVVSFLLGTVLGTLVAVLLWWSPTASRILDPYLVVLNALPKIALGPILIVWIGAGVESIIVMGLLISVIVTVISVLSGFREISSEKQLLMRTLGANKLQIFRMVVLPASLPTIIAALKISVGMSWVGVIVGEYLVSGAGLGYLIVYGSQVFRLDLVMASIIILCALAAIMYYAVAVIEKKLFKWQTRTR